MFGLHGVEEEREAQLRESQTNDGAQREEPSTDQSAERQPAGAAAEPTRDDAKKIGRMVLPAQTPTPTPAKATGPSPLLIIGGALLLLLLLRKKN